MSDETEKLINEMVQQVHELVHEHGRLLGKEEWRDIFAQVMAGAFAGETPDDWEPGQ